MYQPCSSTAATTRREWATAGDDTAHARNSGGLTIDSAAVSLHQIQLSDIVDKMVEVVRTDDFDEWLTKLKDRAGRLRILKRIDRLANGNPGDVKPVGNGVYELRLDVGPGYRVYYAQDGDVLILLLCGGDKSTQQNDIGKAHRLADEWRRDMREASDGQDE